MVNDLKENVIANEDHDHVNTNRNRISKSPYVLCQFNDLKIWSLIDSGSQVTAISENCYNELSQKTQLLELLVTNIVLSLAIGKRTTSIKKQIQFEIEIDGMVITQIFLIVPTNKRGNDFLFKNSIIIHYWNTQIKIKNKIVHEHLVLFDRSSTERILLEKENDVTRIYIIQRENFCVQNILINRIIMK